MKYHIEIDDAYWPRHFPNWQQFSHKERAAKFKEELYRIREWLRGGQGDFYSAKVTNPDGSQVSLVTFRQITDEPPTGAGLIAVERNEQLQKHGFDEAHDDQRVNDELVDAAIALLTEDPERWPKGMDRAQFDSASEKDTVARITVAAAFLAAELDRLLRAREVADVEAAIPQEPKYR